MKGISEVVIMLVLFIIGLALVVFLLVYFFSGTKPFPQELTNLTKNVSGKIS